jgi:hypothetical protein
MLPVNSKSLFATLCNTLEKLDKNEIDVAQANAVANLTKQALGYLVYEVQRAKAFADEKVKKEHRNIELKNFDSLPE